MKDFVGYPGLIEDSMRNVVREILLKIQNTGLQGDHHFVISFLTNDKGVKIPKSLKEKFPEEMIIVIQHQFKDLKVNKLIHQAKKKQQEIFQAQEICQISKL